MLFSCLASGFGSATRHAKLAVALWLATLVLAVPATLVFLAWWWGTLAHAVPGRAIDLAAFIDMLEYSDVNPMTSVFAALGGTIVVALVANAFLSVGVLDVLVGARRARESGTAPVAERLLGRFFHGGGRFFLRSLGVLLVGLVVAAVVVAAGAAAVSAALRPLDSSMSIALAWTRAVLPVVVVAVLVVFCCGVIVDLARVDLVRRDTRNPLGAYWRGLTLALRKWWTSLWIWGVALVLVGLLLALQQVVAPARAPALVAFLGVQLLFLALGWVRVSMLGAELELSSRVRPDPPPPPLEPVGPEPDLSLREPGLQPVVTPDPLPADDTALVAPAEKSPDPL